MDYGEKIELEMRLSALEYLCSKSYAALVLIQAGGDFDVALGLLDQFAIGAEKQMFPGLDPALSDHANAEWTNAIKRLVDSQKRMLTDIRKARGL